MITFLWAILLFFVGVIEFGLDQWEKMVSVRLKFSQTIGYGLLNQWFDFAMNIFLFGILISFWENWHLGIHDYGKLWMYFSYINGRVVGTGLATWLYARNKKQQDKARAVDILTTSNKAKKKRGKRKLSKKVQHSVEVGQLFDSVETEDLKDEIKAQVVENVSQQISNKVDEALNQETNS